VGVVAVGVVVCGGVVVCWCVGVSVSVSEEREVCVLCG